MEQNEVILFFFCREKLKKSLGPCPEDTNKNSFGGHPVVCQNSTSKWSGHFWAANFNTRQKLFFTSRQPGNN